MFIDLELLDIVVRETQTDNRHDDRNSTIKLDIQTTTESSSKNYYSADQAEEDQNEDKIAINAVEEYHTMPYARHKLQAGQHCSRNDCV